MGWMQAQKAFAKQALAYCAWGCFRDFEFRTRSYGNTSRPLWMNHITLVSVTTEANVPISTATAAGSIQVLFCRAMTNTFSAGGSAAISTAVAAHGCANGPNSSSKPNTIIGWIRSLIAITPGTSH